MIGTSWKAACKYFFGNMEATWKVGLFGKHESRQLRRIEIIRLCGGFFYSMSLFVQNFHHDIAKCFRGLRVIAAWWECDSELNRGSILAERKKSGAPKIMT